MSMQVEPPPLQDFTAIVLVIDTSLALGQHWYPIMNNYISPLFRRLSELNPGRPIRIGIVTYTVPDMTNYSPVIHKKFFGEASVVAEVFKKEVQKIGLMSSLSAPTVGMPALEGVAAAIEMIDTLTTSCPATGPGRPVSLNIFHITAVVPDNTVNPQWNDLESLDQLTWEGLPSELQSRNINLSSILLNQDTSVYTKLHATGSAPTWFPVRPPHTVFLSPYFATAPPTGPKRPAESIAMDKSPDSKRPRLGPPVPSPILAGKPTPPNHNPNPTPNGRPAPFPAPGTAPGQTGFPARLTPQQVQALLPKLRASEERIKALEAAHGQAVQSGDTQKAGETATELTKLRMSHKVFREYLTVQIKQIQGTQVQAQASGSGQQTAGSEKGQAPSNNVPPSTQGNGQAENRPPSAVANPPAPAPPSVPAPAPVPNQAPNAQPPLPSKPPSVGPEGRVPPNMPNPPNPGSHFNPNASPNVPPNMSPNMSNTGQNPMGVNLPPGAANQGPQRGMMMPELANQMNKLVEQSERAGAGPRPPMGGQGQGPGPGPLGGMHGPPGVAPPGMPGAPGQHNPPAMMNNGTGGPSFKPPNAAPQPQAVPVWQGIMCWRPDAMNGGREVNANIAVFAGSNNGSHSDTWPKTIYLSSPAQPISPTDVQAWFAQHKDQMFLGRLVPAGPDPSHQDYKFLFANMITKKIYLLGAWTTPNGGQTNNLLIAAAPNSGLLGAFFPHNGLPELPKATSAIVLGQPGQHQQPAQQPMPGPPAGLATMFSQDIKEFVGRIRAMKEDHQRVTAAQSFIVRMQQSALAGGRQLTNTDVTQLLSLMNVTPAQLQQLSARAQQMRLMAAASAGGGGGQGMPGQQGQGRQQPPSMMMQGGGSGTPGMTMGGAGHPGGPNPMMAQYMNGLRGNLGGMNMGSAQQMMNAGSGPGHGMQGLGGGGPAGMHSNVSAEMMQSFAQRNQNGGMGGSG
ncbi:hypothetical protein PQX77_003747 [Marasmius sp. AFHP31]|nr:hypothetical protein PQX77_003747 [Marasmius sp. AFHP31]